MEEDPVRLRPVALRPGAGIQACEAGGWWIHREGERRVSFADAVTPTAVDQPEYRRLLIDLPTQEESIGSQMELDARAKLLSARKVLIEWEDGTFSLHRGREILTLAMPHQVPASREWRQVEALERIAEARSLDELTGAIHEWVTVLTALGTTTLRMVPRLARALVALDALGQAFTKPDSDQQESVAESLIRIADAAQAGARAAGESTMRRALLDLMAAMTDCSAAGADIDDSRRLSTALRQAQRALDGQV